MDFRSGVSLTALLGSMTPMERAAGRYMRAPDHGGAADIVGGDGDLAPAAMDLALMLEAIRW
jgi:hypothetical protein